MRKKCTSTHEVKIRLESPQANWMSSSQEAGGEGGLSPVRTYGLAKLYYKESKQREKEEILDRQRSRTQKKIDEVTETQR